MENKKTKLLWIGDDIRMNSGTATQGRELIIQTVHKYDYAIIAGSITHPDKGKVFDLSQATNEMTGLKDSYVKLYPVDGYSNEQILFQIIALEKPSAICFITDPRFYVWLFALEKQLREMNIPLIYWNIWDNLPYPTWNKAYYESCDALLGISKQTVNINKWVLGPENCLTIN